MTAYVGCRIDVVLLVEDLVNGGRNSLEAWLFGQVGMSCFKIQNIPTVPTSEPACFEVNEK